MKTSRSRHIGIFLFLVFTSSLWGESILSVYNIYQLSMKSGEQAVSALVCQDGFAVSDKMPVTISTDLPSRLFQQIDFEDDQEPETRTVIISNCSTSLQILPVDTLSPIVQESSTFLRSSILLLTGQLFVKQLADPPRIGSFLPLLLH